MERAGRYERKGVFDERTKLSGEGSNPSTYERFGGTHTSQWRTANERPAHG